MYINGARKFLFDMERTGAKLPVSFASDKAAHLVLDCEDSAFHKLIEYLHVEFLGRRILDTIPTLL